MVKLSIPNSTPANGRISTPSLLRLRSQKPEGLSGTQGSRKRNYGPTSFSSSGRVSRSGLFVKCCLVYSSCFPAFLRNYSGRVKGAWWPSRSSKSPSVPNDRGRFDSYPLRLECLRKAGTQERGTNHGQGRQAVVRWRTSGTPAHAVVSEESKRSDARSTSSSFLLSDVPQRFGFPDSKGGDLGCRVNKFAS